MNIEKAMEIVRATNKPTPYTLTPMPETATIWNLPEGHVVLTSVYFVYSAGRIKIGTAGAGGRGLKKRMAQLAASGPAPLTVILVVPGTDKEEKEFHKRFADDRTHFEWFRISKKMRDFLRARLCAKGRAAFKKAEDDFRRYCTEHLGNVEPAGGSIERR